MSLKKFSRWCLENNISEMNENPNQQAEQPENMAPSDFKQILTKLSMKLGEKTNTYIPLLRYVASNPKMLKLLEDLIEATSTMKVSTANMVYKK